VETFVDLEAKQLENTMEGSSADEDDIEIRGVRT
jgi:hypothetical protein